MPFSVLLVDHSEVEHSHRRFLLLDRRVKELYSLGSIVALLVVEDAHVEIGFEVERVDLQLAVRTYFQGTLVNAHTITKIVFVGPCEVLDAVGLTVESVGVLRVQFQNLVVNLNLHIPIE